MRILSKAAIFAAASLLAVAPAVAADLTVDVSGIPSFGELGDPGNISFSTLIGANAHVTGVSYDVTIQAFDPSYLSEITLYFGNTAQDTGVFLSPGFEYLEPGTGSFSDSANLVDLGLDFNVDDDGLLYTEFFEAFDDSSVSPDGSWLSGTVTFTYEDGATAPVPEPASWAMMIAGFGLVGGALRSRRTPKVSYAI